MYRTVVDAALIEAAQRIAPLMRACRDLDRALPSRLLPAFPVGVAVTRVPLVYAAEEIARFLDACAPEKMLVSRA